jgi:hypothetical protein
MPMPTVLHSKTKKKSYTKEAIMEVEGERRRRWWW